MANFFQAVNKILLNEGGYVNDPIDPGGETNFGISKRQYPNIDIKELTKPMARAIYQQDYWNPIQGVKIVNQNVAEQIFDFAVNAGVKTAVQTVQKILLVKIDGVLGPKTLNVLNSYSNLFGFVDRIKTERVKYYLDICKAKPEMKKFLYGWIKRTVE